MQKVCRTCGESKPLKAYYASDSAKDGHFNQCISCYRQARNEYNQAKREEAKRMKYKQKKVNNE
jgi:hypothetical protein